MKKALVGLLAVGLVALVAGGIWLYLSLDFIVKYALESYGSDIVGAKVTVESVQLAPADGAGAVRGLAIGNPPGFRTEQSVAAGRIDVAIDAATVTSKVVHVRRIAVIAPVITYESRRGGSNFDAIRQNTARRSGSTSSGGETRLIVDRLEIRDARVIYAPEIATPGATLSFTIPDIRITDIGKRQGGVTPAELANVIAQALAVRMAKAMGRSAAQRGVESLLRGR